MNLLIVAYYLLIIALSVTAVAEQDGKHLI